MRRQLQQTFTLALLLAVMPLHAAEIYKYQDASGKWRFTDKKPKEPTAETLTLKSAEKQKVEPVFYVDKNEAKRKNYLVVQNPFHAPIQVELRSPQAKQRQSKIIPALSKKTLLSAAGTIEPFTYKWQLGDPKLTPGPQEYQLPADALGCHRITQGFNGKFSHHGDSSRYAVDIALPVGTAIKAARDGVVIAVKDDYHMGGVDKFFLDKANYVRILHQDGTFALYGHILLGTAVVRVGDKVTAGTTLARSGSSGYSSGPHLHFVIHRNTGLKMTAVPFKFIASKSSQTFVPMAGQRLCDM
jgi:murein DD-endopeptidase MepM/ murein hydrolase activator NlpD